MGQNSIEYSNEPFYIILLGQQNIQNTSTYDGGIVFRYLDIHPLKFK